MNQTNEAAVRRVQGRYAEALIYTDIVEETALNQVKTLCDQPCAAGARIRIMPDVHAGAGCTIGTTMTIGRQLIPNLVGVDIGCGMLTVCIGRQAMDLRRLDEVIHRDVPAGFNVHEQPIALNDQIDLSRLRCAKEVNLPYAGRSLGSLGGGNHFIEVDEDDDGNRYIVVHTGSRHLGLQVAGHYQKAGYHALEQRARGLDNESLNQMVKEMKAQGRASEISARMAELRSRRAELTVPQALAYVEDELFDAYIHDMKLVQRFAQLNRQAIMAIILGGMGLAETDRFETIHNYIDTDHMILRKGAVSAMRGERLLIPINMRDGSLICTGLGNEDWNCSAPHGAGRLLSRAEARRRLSMDEFTRSMHGIYTTTATQDTIDEAPMCYKSMHDILRNITPTVQVTRIIRPVYNFKAGE